MANGYQLCVHAIGDRANREVLNIFEAAFKANPDKKDVRWRIEHAQHLHPADIPRFGQLGVIASMQGIHCTSDAVFVPARLGAKRSEEGAYVWQKLMKSGALVSNGTDAPVEDIDPIPSYYATRHAQAQGRLDLLSRPAHEPAGSAPVVHSERRLRRLRRGTEGLAGRGQARGRDRSLHGHPDRPRGGDPERRGWTTRSSAARSFTRRSDEGPLDLRIRPAVAADVESLWPIFRAVVATGTTYVFAPDTSREVAYDYWFGPGVSSYVAEDAGGVVGMYKLVANQRDLGSHVANASFMVDPASAGRGIGRALGVHCLREARRAGFLAMQFNFVVSTNTGAVELWKDLGFAVVGTLPKVFRHRERGLVDAYVMHRFLDDIEPLDETPP